MDHFFKINEKGNAFVENQINKRISFSVKFPYILLVISVVIFLVKAHPITTQAVFFGVSMYLIFLFLDRRAFKKMVDMHQHLIKNIEISEDNITLTGFNSYRKAEATYVLKSENCTLKKGIPKNEERNIYDIKDTFYLESPDFPGVYFFFISSFWDDWQEIKNLITHE